MLLSPEDEIEGFLSSDSFVQKGTERKKAPEAAASELPQYRVFEAGVPACGCVSYPTEKGDKLVYGGFWIAENTKNKQRAVQELIKGLLNSTGNVVEGTLTIITQPNDSLVIDTLSRAGLSLVAYTPDKHKKGLGAYKWKINLPYRGSYREHRAEQIEMMAEKIHVLRPHAPQEWEWLELFSTAEAEAFDNVYVKNMSVLNEREEALAANFVKRRLQEDPSQVPYLVDPRARGGLGYIARNVRGDVFGVLRAHVNRENVCIIDFLDASGIAEEARKAQLLLELLKSLEFRKVDRVVLPAVPIADVGTVSLASELGFSIKANSADSLLMVRDGDLPLPQDEVVVVIRKLRAKYTAVKAYRTRPGIRIRREVLDVLDEFRHLSFHKQELIERKTRALFAHAGAVLLLLSLGALARKIHNYRKNKEYLRRFRSARLVDDLSPQREEVAVEARPALGGSRAFQ